MFTVTCATAYGYHSSSFMRGLPTRAFHAHGSHRPTNLTLGIRREDPLRLIRSYCVAPSLTEVRRRTWERRCPLSPHAVQELVNMGLRVVVQECSRRIWSSDEFEQAGARMVPSVAAADIVVGIKEVPISELSLSILERQTHFMFSHTHKGQAYNMPLLGHFARQGRLIDYELLTGRGGKRSISFGWFAGAAGLVEGLCAFSRHLLSIGITSPFLHLPRPYYHPSLSKLRLSLRAIGEEITERGTPKEAGPIVIAVTGSGQVASGALDLLNELPYAHVAVEDLPRIAAGQGIDLRKIYVVQVPAAAYLSRIDGQQYDRSHYYANPSMYRSTFHNTVAAYISVLINGVAWRPGFPRLMNTVQLSKALLNGVSVGPGRLRTIADVTCDIEGGLEFVTKASTIDNPFYMVRPTTSPVDADGVQIMSIDILPAELPLDASEHFSKALLPYIRTFVRQQNGLSLGPEDIAVVEALDRATIAKDGELQGEHRWLYSRLEAPEPVATVGSSQSKHKILLLGSGMVTKPVVDKISKRTDVILIIASNNIYEARQLACGRPNVECVYADASDATELDTLIQLADVVISLLPALLHPFVAEFCIKYKKHLVTASYISPAMRALQDRALSAGVLLMNECGLDPGLDHCTAVDLINRVTSSKKTVASFISFCGGLPAPEHANVPLSYKFSWAPRGVLTATKNAATFKLGNEIVHIPGEILLASPFTDVPICNGFAFEGLANRNSLDYLAPYGLGPLESMTAHLRGTLRYKGFASLMSSFQRMGFLDECPLGLQLPSWDSFTDVCIARVLGIDRVRNAASRKSAMRDLLSQDEAEEAEGALQWLGLLPCTDPWLYGNEPMPPVPLKPLPAIDLLCLLLTHRLRYLPEERDMVVLSHEIVVLPDRGLQPLLALEHEPEVYNSMLIAHGTADCSAMARTVGLPVACAALRILDGKIDGRGVKGPTDDRVYVQLLEDLEAESLKFQDTVRRGHGLDSKLLQSWKCPNHKPLHA